jgi:hypothetical protein
MILDGVWQVLIELIRQQSVEWHKVRDKMLVLPGYRVGG